MPIVGGFSFGGGEFVLQPGVLFFYLFFIYLFLNVTENIRVYWGLRIDFVGNFQFIFS